MKTKAILFDLDGTLIEFPKKFLFSQAYQVFDSLRLKPCGSEEMESAFRDFDFFRIAPEAIRDEFMDTYWKLFDWDSYPGANLIEGVEATLAKLKSQGLELAVVTSRDEPVEHIKKRLENTNLLDFILFIIPRSCPDSEWSDKSKQITAACERLHLSPEEVALVGDIPPDIESATKCGVGLKVGLLSGGISKERLLESKPDYLFSDVNQLLTIF